MGSAGTPDTPIQRASEPEPKSGTGLCLSGGGYRAMLFHLGSLKRLNELGYLKKLDRISSVSGGSIVAGLLGLAWRYLEFDAKDVATNFEERVSRPVRDLACRAIDATSIVSGVLLPGSVADKLVAAYDKYLFHGATLQDLPDDPPRFVINSSNVQSGALWRFMKPYMRDWKVGEVKKPRVALAVAVAASSAFPPFLSPLELDLDPASFTSNSGDPGQNLQKVPLTSQVVLTDGGVYDNLGLETCWKKCKSILVSDGGAAFAVEANPKRDWAQHTYRVLEMIDNQVRSLRKRELVGALERKERLGAYWSIRSDPANCGLKDPMPLPDHHEDIAATPTRLKALDEKRQEQLIQMGYALCDTAIRKWV